MQERELPMLIMHDGQQIGQEWVLETDEVSIGRDDDNAIVLPDRRISRRHAVIEHDDDRYYIRDCDSKNGTFLNDELLQGSVALKDGDDISVAMGFTLTFVDAGATTPLFFEGHRGVVIDDASRQVWVRGQELEPPLSTQQYRLLYLLYENIGKVVTREEIVRVVWPDAIGGGVSEQAIDALVRRLRDRIAEVDPDHQYVVTVRGHGFRLENAP
ncbi:MAG: Response regulator ArlR [Anaerolineales bacterium]|nr:Response regulator ArlR [Anaerolineales bacterium]